ncbi:nuclear transport factor 2 family protein [Dactylosporangium sp. CA-092794]|uniref:nuclear transport factor 2 family protein n=1 Tax=Dactylosporangium sp. CA-092794 TaxID=3239929 RepID=UPI003D8F9E08
MTNAQTMAQDVKTIFAGIDTLDPANFVRHLTEDVVFQFGNNDPVVGRDAVAEGVRGFYTTIAGMRHDVRQVYVDGDIAIAKVDIVYTRLDGKSVTVPNADILTFEGDKVRDWRIYIDLTPVYA